ncbi:MAG: hypothetical protein MPI95_00620 [Nitrosopumilus sp.]|nr:hypothetical protein [Nitrosopumilus sp.]CAI9832836.1 hypothetical protein IBTHAUMO2_990068 [Nitrosopumilaceae archaeon]MDA7944348.1 hypothetical protein [Nitrosopumilus sp.]MDA7952446.1 hypothetical protein [Nitrosopumilus sp.]MDA7954100.1 hypothetical protein [Nitrosopumilus sp.]
MEKTGLAASISVTAVAVLIAVVLGDMQVIPQDDRGCKLDGGCEVRTRSVVMSTDKPEYRLGETVTYILHNEGDVTVKYPDTSRGAGVKEASGRQVAGNFPGFAITPLVPGERVVHYWHQTDSFSKLVRPGNFVAFATYAAPAHFVINSSLAYPWMDPADGQQLVLGTDKPEYERGEPVRYFIMNTGTEDLTVGMVHEIHIKNATGTVVETITRMYYPGTMVYGPQHVDRGTWFQPKQGADPGTYVVATLGLESAPFAITESVFDSELLPRNYYR